MNSFEPLTAVSEPGRVVVREGVRRQEVAAPDLGRVDAQLVGEEVHRPLDHVGRLGPARAAIRVHERGVGVDARDLGVDVGDLVRAGEDAPVEGGRDAGSDRRQAPAEVGEGLDPQALDLAVAVRRRLDVGDVVAAVDRAAVALAPALDPFHREAAHQLAGEHHERHVGVAEDLGAEGAADVGADAADLVLRDAGHEGGQQQPLDVRRLARHPDRVFLGARVVPADVAADLHRVRDEPVVHQALLDDDLGVLERGIGAVLVADRPHEHDVVGGVLVELRRARLGRLLGVHDRRQRHVLDVDELERVLRLRRRLGDDRRDTLARPLDRVGRERARDVDVVLEAAAPPAGQAMGSGLYGMSAPTMTARTPGALFALDVSIEAMFAWAYGLRRMAMWTIPWSWMSSR